MNIINKTGEKTADIGYRMDTEKLGCGYESFAKSVVGYPFDCGGSNMTALKEYIEAIEIPEQRERMIHIFNWIDKEFPMLVSAIKWNQPMFIHDGTFIIGFSMAKHHMSFTPEEVVVTLFLDEIKKSGYDHTKGLVKVKWNQDVDYTLLRKMIEFNIEDKAGYKTFFRK